MSEWPCGVSSERLSPSACHCGGVCEDDLCSSLLSLADIRARDGGKEIVGFRYQSRKAFECSWIAVKRRESNFTCSLSSA